MNARDDDDIGGGKIQVLTPEQLSALNQAKVRIRMDSELYLREHPEAARLMRGLVRGIIRDRPTSASTYAFRFFARDAAAIRQELNAD